MYGGEPMIYNTEVVIGFKTENNNIIVERGTIFQLCDLIQGYHAKNIIFNKKSKEIFIKLKCSFCGEVHCYVYRVQELLSKDIVIGGCEKTGNPILFIGKEKAVSNVIEKYKEVEMKVYSMI